MKHLSSTSSSKKTYALRFTAFIALLALVWTLCCIAADATKRDSQSTWRVQDYMVWDFYDSPRGAYNAIFIGTSHTMCSIDPDVFDSLEGYDISCYNMGGSSILPDASYYLLLDAFDRNPDIKFVALDLYYNIMDVTKDKSYTASLVWRPMDLTWAKVRMFFDDFTFDEQGRLLKTWTNPFYRLKQTAVYQTDLAIGREEEFVDTTGGLYVKKGFYTFPDRVLNSAALKTELKAKPESYNGISSRQKEYVKKIAELCREKGAKLVFFSTPLSPTYKSFLPFLNEPIAELQSLADECGVEYIEYNRESEYLRAGFTDAAYADKHHFNQGGAKLFSELFASDLIEKGYFDAFRK